MELYQLKSFVAVAEEENLTRAAERLFTSPPAVSAHIKALEEETGVALFDRTARGMSITADGEKLLEEAQAALACVASLNSLARDLQARPSGRLKVGVNLGGEALKLDRISEAFVARLPGVRLEFFHSSSGVIQKSLIAGELDVGFSEGQADAARLSALPIGVTRVVVVGAPSLAEAFEAQDWEPIAALPWVFKTPDCSFHQLMETIAQARGLSLNKRYVIDHEATCLQFVKRGLGVSLVDESLVRQELARGEIIAWPAYRGELPLSLLCLTKRAQERGIRAFFEAARETLE